MREYLTNEGIKFLEDHNLITKKTTGYIIIDLQESLKKIHDFTFIIPK